MKTELLDNTLVKYQHHISVSRNSSYIYVSEIGIKNIEYSRRLTVDAFNTGKKLNINRYLFNITDTDFNESFITKCDYFYNAIISIASSAEKIALLMEGVSDLDFLLQKLINYYMDNFKLFKSKKAAVEYLVNNTKTETPRKLKYPCSSIPRHSILEFSVNSGKCKCILCRNTEFRFDPDRNRSHSFKCMKCGAEYSLSDFSYTENSKFDFRIIT